MVFVLSKISAPPTLFLLALKYLAFFPVPILGGQMLVFFIYIDFIGFIENCHSIRSYNKILLM